MEMTKESKPTATRETIDMLQKVYENTTMGDQGCKILMQKTQDAGLLDNLRQYDSSYLSIRDDAKMLLDQYGAKPQEPDGMKKASQWMGIEMHTMGDKSVSHLAEMLIQGNAMGVIKAEKTKSRNRNADIKAVALEDRLVDLEEEFLDNMKKFL